MLKPMEFDLLLVLAKNKNIAIFREKLLKMVWGVDFMGETRTVDVHIGQLRKKLGLEKRIDVFNNTIFGAEFLGNIKFSNLREDLTNLSATRFQWESRLFLLYNCDIGNSYQVYKLEDM